LKIAGNIIEREGKGQAKAILDIMGVEIMPNGSLNIKEEPFM
jgi:hypothetical protein